MVESQDELDRLIESWNLCAYCRTERAVNRDHIVPKRLLNKKRPDGSPRYPGWENVTVPACFACNMRKGDRPLVPVGYERLPELQGLAVQEIWTEWDGGDVVTEVLRV